MSQPHIVLQKKLTAINEMYASMIFILTSLTLRATVRNNDGVSWWIRTSVVMGGRIVTPHEMGIWSRAFT